MKQVMISGALGVMGKHVAEAVLQTSTLQVCCGLDIQEDTSTFSYPVYASVEKIQFPIDVAIDFSVASALDTILHFCLEKKIPLVLCTTGYTQNQIVQIVEASKKIPIFYSGNMSLGVNVLQKLLQSATPLLQDGFDIEIIEAHHNRKIDAPSGTAKMLFDTISQASSHTLHTVYDRESRLAPRDANEVGMHTIRGGNIVGDHSVLFCGKQEIIELKHSALSRAVFAEGAVRAAQFIVDKKSGLYDMDDMLSPATPALAVVEDSGLIRVSGLMPLHASALLFETLEKAEIGMKLLDGMTGDICMLIENELLSAARQALQPVVGQWNAAIMLAIPHVTRFSVFVQDGGVLSDIVKETAKESKIVTLSYWDHILNIYFETDFEKDLLDMLHRYQLISS